MEVVRVRPIQLAFPSHAIAIASLRRDKHSCTLASRRPSKPHNPYSPTEAMDASTPASESTMLHQFFTMLLQGCGAVLILAILLDAFLTVLYARVGVSILSNQLGRLSWRGFRFFAKRRSARRRAVILSFCGPLLMVGVLALWVGGLAIGAAMIMYPHLGTSIRAAGGDATPTGFVDAVFAATSIISTIGSTQAIPQSLPMKLFFIFQSLIGISMITLTLTYLMQVYTALQRRSTAALHAHISTAETGDAAEFIKGLAPAGDFSGAPARLASAATELSAVKESHHFYSLLMYFRFPDAEHSPCRLVVVMLDSLSLIWSALDHERYRTLTDSGAAADLWRASKRMVVGLDDSLLEQGAPDEWDGPDASTLQAWRRRFKAAIDKLHEAGIETCPDEESGFARYVKFRSQWQPRVDAYRDFAAFDPEEVDPIGAACANDSAALESGRAVDLSAAA